MSTDVRALAYRHIAAWLPGIVLLALAGCGQDVRELSRVSNSTGTLDAVVTEGTPTAVYLLPKGSRVKGDPVFQAQQVQGLHVTWQGELKLDVQADHAQVLSQQERVIVYVVGPGSQFVQVGYRVGR